MHTNQAINNSDAIDAVITWVDGEDPNHKKKLNNYLSSIGRTPSSAHSTRFNEAGEFIYCVTSILKFAPWIRKIFIVTDAQTPYFMDLIYGSNFADKISIVDHKVIFEGFESNLPTFNSLSIESLLWRIPDLANRYIYFNDDCILLKPIVPETFFIGEKIVLRGKWEIQHTYRWYNSIFNIVRSRKTENRVKNRIAQALSAKIASFPKKYFRVPHNPHPQLKQLQVDFFSNNKELLINNIKFPLRSEKQFVPASLTTHLALKNNRAIVNNKYSTIRLKLNKLSLPLLKINLLMANINKNTAFTCLQSLDLASYKVKKETLKWLERRIGSLKSLIQSTTN